MVMICHMQALHYITPVTIIIIIITIIIHPPPLPLDQPLK